MSCRTPPFVAVFFSCTDISKQNSGRNELKNNPKKGEGTTGVTLDCCCYCIELARPKWSVLECAPEMQMEVEQDDGSYETGSDHVANILEAKGFTVIIADFCQHLRE